MINLERVTITGADDNTNANDLVSLSKEFPFVEWGILISKNAPASRFPSLNWIDAFFILAKDHSLNVSTHICGWWVKQLLKGELVWSDLPACLEVSQRVQINTHAQTLPSTAGFLENLKMRYKKQFIFQGDGVNDHLATLARQSWVSEGSIYQGRYLDVALLFDKSGGAGIEPEVWPKKIIGMYCGYAGGLGPENILGQLEKISEVCSRPFWIDMEYKVRTDEKLDLDKVRAVLKITKSIVEEASVAREKAQKEHAELLSWAARACSVDL